MPIDSERLTASFRCRLSETISDKIAMVSCLYRRPIGRARSSVSYREEMIWCREGGNLSKTSFGHGDAVDKKRGLSHVSAAIVQYARFTSR